MHIFILYNDCLVLRNGVHLFVHSCTLYAFNFEKLNITFGRWNAAQFDILFCLFNQIKIIARHFPSSDDPSKQHWTLWFTGFLRKYTLDIKLRPKKWDLPWIFQTASFFLNEWDRYSFYRCPEGNVRRLKGTSIWGVMWMLFRKRSISWRSSLPLPFRFLSARLWPRRLGTSPQKTPFYFFPSDSKANGWRSLEENTKRCLAVTEQRDHFRTPPWNTSHSI